VRAVLSGQSDPTALPVMRITANPFFNAQLRTTCVATMLEGGAAINACRQLASAKVNCRVIPGEPIEGVKAALEKVLADDQIVVTPLDSPTLSAPSVLSDQVLGRSQTVGRILAWRGGVADHEYRRHRRQLSSQRRHPHLRTFGLAGDIAENRAHGRDERIQVKSFFEGGEYLYRLVKAFAGGQ